MGLLLKTSVPASPTFFVKQVGSFGKQALQNSPDSVQSSTLKEATLLFLVAVTLYHRPIGKKEGKIDYYSIR